MDGCAFRRSQKVEDETNESMPDNSVRNQRAGLKFTEMARAGDQEFLEYLIKALVDNPDVVKSDRKVDEMGVLLTLHVDPADMGKIIGRNGQTAKAIRSLLRVVGIKNNARVNLKIEEPEGGRGPRPARTDLDSVVDDLSL